MRAHHKIYRASHSLRPFSLTSYAGAPTFVIFGVAALEHSDKREMEVRQALGGGQQQQQPRGGSRMGGMGGSPMGGGMPPRGPSAPSPRPQARVEEEEDAGDTSDIDPKDIELVMTQAGCSRAQAVGALRTANGDIVSAIMELTL